MEKCKGIKTWPSSYNQTFVQLPTQSEKMGNLLKKRHLFSSVLARGVSTSVKQTINNFFSPLLHLAQMYHRYSSTFLKFVSRLFLPGNFTG